MENILVDVLRQGVIHKQGKIVHFGTTYEQHEFGQGDATIGHYTVAIVVYEDGTVEAVELCNLRVLQ